MVPSRTSMWLEAQDSAAKHSTTHGPHLRLNPLWCQYCQGWETNAGPEQSSTELVGGHQALPLTVLICSSHDRPLRSLNRLRDLTQSCQDGSRPGTIPAPRPKSPSFPWHPLTFWVWYGGGGGKAHGGVVFQRPPAQGVLGLKYVIVYLQLFWKLGKNEQNLRWESLIGCLQVWFWSRA